MHHHQSILMAANWYLGKTGCNRHMNGHMVSMSVALPGQHPLRLVDPSRQGYVTNRNWIKQLLVPVIVLDEKLAVVEC